MGEGPSDSVTMSQWWRALSQCDSVTMVEGPVSVSPCHNGGGPWVSVTVSQWWKALCQCHHVTMVEGPGSV